MADESFVVFDPFYPPPNSNHPDYREAARTKNYPENWIPQ
jgi:hypothetical protein